ncbi:MAG: low molecular weight protein-tyrosine-phosphatase, partial [Planctomycetota bacterium]
MEKVKVLFVCTGNICRSPTAEGVLRKLVSDAGLGNRIEVDSAGTEGYHVGDPPDPRAIRTASRRGYDLSGLRARRVKRGDFERFDLLISMDRGHHERLLALC